MVRMHLRPFLEVAFYFKLKLECIHLHGCLSKAKVHYVCGVCPVGTFVPKDRLCNMERHMITTHGDGKKSRKHTSSENLGHSTHSMEHENVDEIEQDDDPSVSHNAAMSDEFAYDDHPMMSHNVNVHGAQVLATGDPSHRAQAHLDDEHVTRVKRSKYGKEHAPLVDYDSDMDDDHTEVLSTMDDIAIPEHGVRIPTYPLRPLTQTLLRKSIGTNTGEPHVLDWQLNGLPFKIPNTVRCVKGEIDRSRCQWRRCGVNTPLKLLTIKGIIDVSPQRYECAVHKAKVSVSSALLKDAVMEAGATLSYPCFVFDRVHVSPEFIDYVWKMGWAMYTTTTDIRRSLVLLYEALVQNDMYLGEDKKLQEKRDDWVSQIPVAKTLDKMMFELWTIKNRRWGPLLHESEMNDEGQVLHFDFTYRAVGGIWINAPIGNPNDPNFDPSKRQRCQLSYCLGTVFGSKGMVLAATICSTEKWDNIKEVFNMAFMKTGVAPRQIWIDDYQKWGRLLEDYIKEKFPNEPEPTTVGQDWRHFKELLLSNMDRQHSQFPDVRKEVEGLLTRLRDIHHDEYIPDGVALQHAVRKIFNAHAGHAGQATSLVRGRAFARLLTFDVCAAIGKGLHSAKTDIDIEALTTGTNEGYGVFNNHVRQMWIGKLSAPIDYWNAVALVSQVPEECSAGTNIAETFHSTLRRSPTLCGRKGFNKALLAIDLAAKKFNAAIHHSTYLPSVHNAGDEIRYIRTTHSRVRVERFDAGLLIAEEDIKSILSKPTTVVSTSMFWELQETHCPDGTYETLPQRGFQVRISSKMDLTQEEKDFIRDCLYLLHKEGAEVLGRYKYVADWIAIAKMGGVRTATKVAQEVREIVKREINKMVHKGARAIPTGLILTQHDDEDIGEDITNSEDESDIDE